jgi:hypothetical protein
MSTSRKIGMPAMLPLQVGGAIFEAAEALVADRAKAFRLARRVRTGTTPRPGVATPLWNTLATEVRPHLKKRGSQAMLARLLGLDRQQVNAYFVQRTRMPDAERTLQIIAWLVAQRPGETPPA